MNIIEQNLYRALCYSCDDYESTEVLKWREGYLGWIEVNSCPVVSDKEAVDEDKTIYFIGCKRPNSTADWGLAYPQSKFYIPEEKRHTITRYTGYTDIHGVRVFNGDIIQNIDFPEVCQYIENDKAYDENHIWDFLYEYTKPYTNEFDCYKVVGNIFEWEELSKEVLEWFKTTIYYKQNIRGD